MDRHPASSASKQDGAPKLPVPTGMSPVGKPLSRLGRFLHNIPTAIIIIAIQSIADAQRHRRTEDMHMLKVLIAHRHERGVEMVPGVHHEDYKRAVGHERR